MRMECNERIHVHSSKQIATNDLSVGSKQCYNGERESSTFGENKRDVELLYH